ncbi:MAG TPA: SigE family RNA polymerase sigma factor [Mycobacteriales bacterium]|jgi:RNA polymerase sigma-70 factor (sigma-E family)|nr:SigE family RNA polymerase sigma factor [Mycobacteriales bacterium]
MGTDRDEEFTAFAAAATPALLRTAYLLCLDRALAEDLTQTALARLYVAWPRLARRGELHGYARQVVVRAFVDERRRPWRRERATADLPDHAGAEPYGDVDERDRLRRAVATLPRRQRAVVVLRVWDDLSVAQTATALGISEGAVKSQLSRALDALRATLADTTEAGR